MTDDIKLIAEAQLLIDQAKRLGTAFLFVPVGLVEALVEKATRPHD